MTDMFSPIQLDGLREVMNTGAGHAAADLGEMYNRGFDIDVPATRVLPVDQAIAAVGQPLTPLTAVSVRVRGGLNGVLVVMVGDDAARALCSGLGMDWPSDMSLSLLQETGNLLACAYAAAIGEMVGESVEVFPPNLIGDAHGATVATVRESMPNSQAQAVLVESSMRIRDSATPANVEILMVPDEGGIQQMMDRLGLGGL